MAARAGMGTLQLRGRFTSSSPSFDQADGHYRGKPPSLKRETEL